MSRPGGEWREWLAIALVSAGVVAFLLFYFASTLRLAAGPTEPRPIPAETRP